MANSWKRSSAVETAAELRKLPVRDSPIGRWILHIDHRDQAALYERYPELDARVTGDAAYSNREFLRWAKSSASEPYRTGAKI